ncbi:cytoskeleton protein RodZ [Polaromonas sp. YR568]|nr:cytoskeleton protein RodZ [Polaromonas sp. YR568]
MSDLDPMPAAQSAGESGFSHGSDAAPELTAGALLRQAREAAGIHIAALAVSLKVPVKKLEALEQDRLDLLPDSVFVRALASSVCRTLKLDAAAVLERLPQTSAPKLTYQGAGINAPFRSPGEGPGPSIWTQVSRTAVLAGLALLLGALVLIFMPVAKQDAANGKVEADGMPAAGVEAVKPLPAVVAMASPAPAEAPAPVVQGPVASAGAAPAGAPQPAAAVPLSISGLSPATPPAVRASAAVSVPAVVVAPLVPAPAASPAVPPGIVTFQAKGESWVEVTDAKGTVVLRRTLTAGEVAAASGVLPLAAVVGRADATQVQVRGKAFDLNAVARDNVARFEVK